MHGCPRSDCCVRLQDPRTPAGATPGGRSDVPGRKRRSLGSMCGGRAAVALPRRRPRQHGRDPVARPEGGSEHRFRDTRHGVSSGARTPAEAPRSPPPGRTDGRPPARSSPPGLMHFRCRAAPAQRRPPMEKPCRSGVPLRSPAGPGLSPNSPAPPHRVDRGLDSARHMTRRGIAPPGEPSARVTEALAVLQRLETVAQKAEACARVHLYAQAAATYRSANEALARLDYFVTGPLNSPEALTLRQVFRFLDKKVRTFLIDPPIIVAYFFFLYADRCCSEFLTNLFPVLRTRGQEAAANRRDRADPSNGALYYMYIEAANRR
ncbi:hypothetical protein HPB47_011782 [Ixodes persulcatus]|uniref:Uncharacterized protein n=1 Tax=Ixodes persulcatus TaxID=34615 RepID=A0AC60NVK0_IXOPE|nr:hypothetical protein HPB47_011782 [Ixodes persulcatus]